MGEKVVHGLRIIFFLGTPKAKGSAQSDKKGGGSKKTKNNTRSRPGIWQQAWAKIESVS